MDVTPSNRNPSNWYSSIHQRRLDSRNLTTSHLLKSHEYIPCSIKQKSLNSTGLGAQDVQGCSGCLQDSKLFLQILRNENHVLHQLLPPVRNVPYSLRPRAHDREVPVANAPRGRISFIACCAELVLII